MTKHPVNSVCCVVRDSLDAQFFGYITTEPANNNQRYSHVFSTECAVRIPSQIYIKFRLLKRFENNFRARRTRS